jgi:hypothetical protein
MAHDTRDYSEPTPMRDEPKKHGDALGDSTIRKNDQPPDPLNGDRAGSRNGDASHEEPPHQPER